MTRKKIPKCIIEMVEGEIACLHSGVENIRSIITEAKETMLRCEATLKDYQQKIVELEEFLKRV